MKNKQRNLDKNNALAIDLGIDNLATCVTTTGKSFIADGKRLKSINQWFNKYNTRLQSIKDKQGNILNAYINETLNILRKSKVVDLEVLYHKREVYKYNTLNIIMILTEILIT